MTAYPMMRSAAIGATRISVEHTLEAIDEREWNALACETNPFFEYGFLRTLEVSAAVGPQTAWRPRYMTLTAAGRLTGAIPFYVKTDSYGEFIFDWQWAEAYQRAGIDYYPKAVVAVPFTPVTGERILVHPDHSFEDVAGPMTQGLLEFAGEQRLSGIHVLFPSQAEHDFLVRAGFLSRVGHQFHWHNRGYASFEEFLADLRSKKRKSILKERRQVAESGVEVGVFDGDAITEEHMEAMWRFYLDTIERKWSQAYLTRATFAGMLERCRDRLVLVMARDGERWVAGSLNFAKGGRLYGRYWGTLVDCPGLHFECCFYRLIEYAIEKRLEIFEAGAQGEHKFLRGFAAYPTHSAHWIAHPGGERAIAEFLESERGHNQALVSRYNSVSPLKHVRATS